MYAFELGTLLKSIAKLNPHFLYLGIYEINELNIDNLRRLSTNEIVWFLVIHQNEHWTGLAWNNHSLSFLDSLGKDLSYYNFDFSINLQSSFTCSIRHIPFPLQSEQSKICGFFVCYFAWVLARGRDIRNIISSFRPNHFTWNESLVSDWFEKHLGHKVSNGNP